VLPGQSSGLSLRCRSGVARRCDNLVEFVFGVIDAGHIGEGDPGFLLRIHARATFAKGQYTLYGSHTSAQQAPQAHHEGDRKESREEDTEPVAFRLPGVRHLMCCELANEVLIIDPNGHKAARVFETRVIWGPVRGLLTREKRRTANPISADLHLLQMPLAEDCLEFTVR
jgi:hypothetical protein